MIWLAISSASLLSACSPSPCANCRTVSGNYLETLVGANTGCGDQQYLIIASTQDQAYLTQTGSALQLSGYEGMSGTLHDDGSASFGPVPATFEPVDADGNPDPTGNPVGGRFFLDGWFTNGAADTSTFEGTYFFIADDDGCEIDARVTWSP